MPSAKPHISVCICTYKRLEYLDRLLRSLDEQETGDQFTYSIVVVDNDQQRSAEPVVSKFAGSSPIAIVYCLETRQNIPMARNKAIENAHGDFVAFIDDDEFPIKEWLRTLFDACHKYKVDGVLGPVKRHFDQTPPKWLLKSDLYERKTYPTGLVIDWPKGRTGNVLLKTHLFADGAPPFNPEFRQGEDQDFFRRMIAKGHVFVWCNEAIAYEVVPPFRWRRSVLLRRALLRGSMEPKTAEFGFANAAKSIIAVPAYVVALPFAFLLGQHRFMDLMVRLCDHLGKLLAMCGIEPVREPYVTE